MTSYLELDSAMRVQTAPDYGDGGTRDRSSPAACSGGSGRWGVLGHAVGAGSVSRHDDARRGPRSHRGPSSCVDKPLARYFYLAERGQVVRVQPQVAGRQPAVDLGGAAGPDDRPGDPVGGQG